MTDWNALLAGDWPALLPAIAALPPAAQKKLGSWAKAQWQAELAHEHQQSLTEKAYGQQASETDIARWMQLLIAHTATGPQGKVPIPIPIPRRHWDGTGWPVPLEARAALAQAVVNRGTEYAQAWVDRHTLGKRALVMYPEVILAVIDAAGLNLPSDPQLVERWLRRLPIWPSRLWGTQAKAEYRPAIETLAVRHGQAGAQVLALRHAAAPPAQAAAHIHGFARMWHEGLRHPNLVDVLVPLVTDEPETVRATVQALFEHRTLDRLAVWQDTLQALTRGDSPSAQRTLAKLAAWCAPDATQVAANEATLINLLAGNVGQVAELAQGLLRQQEAAAPLSDAAFVQASQMVFARKEKGLKRQQLAWAEQRARSALPEPVKAASKAKRGTANTAAKPAIDVPRPTKPSARMSSALLAMGEALADADYALQRQAVQAICQFWPHWLQLAQAGDAANAKPGDAAAALIAQLDASSALLDASLRTQLHTTWGMHDLPPENRRQGIDTPTIALDWTLPSIQTSLPPAPPFTPLAGPQLDPESHQRAIGLAQASANPGTEVFEQLVALAVRRLREQGEAALGEARQLFAHIGWGDGADADWRSIALLEVHGLPGQADGEPPSFKRGHWAAEGLLPSMAVMVARMLELRAALFGLPPTPQPRLPDGTNAAPVALPDTPWPGALRPLPPLLSRPSRINGAIDATGLLARLREAALAGPQAPLCMGPNDLLLALLRCGPADADTIAGLRALRRHEATLAADFLAAGGSSQLHGNWCTGQVLTLVRQGDAYTSSHQAEIMVEASPIAHRPPLNEVPMTWALGHSAGNAQSPHDWDMREHWLAGVLPLQAEALAMWLLWNMRKAGHDIDSINGKGTALHLPMVVAAGGPAGPALHLAVLYGISANDASVRLVGSDALITLIEQGFDVELASQLIDATVRMRSVKAVRLAPGLARVVDAGHAPAVWPLLQAAVQAALALDKAPPGTPDLLALATRLAAELGAPAPRAAMQEAVALAAVRGSGKLAQEAKRLLAVLQQSR